jgi:hypothetical protein
VAAAAVCPSGRKVPPRGRYAGPRLRWSGGLRRCARRAAPSIGSCVPSVPSAATATAGRHDSARPSLPPLAASLRPRLRPRRPLRRPWSRPNGFPIRPRHIPARIFYTRWHPPRRRLGRSARHRRRRPLLATLSPMMVAPGVQALRTQVPGVPPTTGTATPRLPTPPRPRTAMLDSPWSLAQARLATSTTGAPRRPSPLSTPTTVKGACPRTTTTDLPWAPAPTVPRTTGATTTDRTRLGPSRRPRVLQRQRRH